MDTRTSQLSTVTTQNITQTAIWFTAESCHKMCQVTDFTQAQYIIKTQLWRYRCTSQNKIHNSPTHDKNIHNTTKLL